MTPVTQAIGHGQAPWETAPTVPDPTQFPAATGLDAWDTSAYDALDVPGMAAGDTYDDPVTATEITKVSSASFPTANSSLGVGGDYSDFGNRISLPWGAGEDTYTICYKVHGSGWWLVDYQLGVGLDTDSKRQLTGSLAPDKDICFSFSNNPATPRIAYVINGGDLKRIDTDSMSVANTGNFPQTSFSWWGQLMHDRNDEWFIARDGPSSTTWCAWKSGDDTLLTKTAAETGVGGVNELRLERDGEYAIFTDTFDTAKAWRLSDDTLGPLENGGTFRFFHNASLRGYWSSNDPSPAIPWATDRYEIDTGDLSLSKTRIVANGVGAGGATGHFAGNWIQTPADLLDQWFILANSWWSSATPGFSTALYFQGAVGFLKLDDLDPNGRLACHTYNINNGEYWSITFVDISPDGKLVRFTSSMNLDGSANRFDSFVFEVPRS